MRLEVGSFEYGRVRGQDERAGQGMLGELEQKTSTRGIHNTPRHQGSILSPLFSLSFFLCVCSSSFRVRCSIHPYIRSSLWRIYMAEATQVEWKTRNSRQSTMMWCGRRRIRAGCSPPQSMLPGASLKLTVSSSNRDSRSNIAFLPVDSPHHPEPACSAKKQNSQLPFFPIPYSARFMRAPRLMAHSPPTAQYRLA